MLSQRGTLLTIGAGSPDRYNVIVGEVTATKNDVPYRLQQTDSVEVTIGETTVISDWKLYLGPDEPATNRSRFIDADGRTFEFTGAPYVVRSPRGPHHIEARVRFVA